MQDRGREMAWKSRQRRADAQGPRAFWAPRRQDGPCLCSSGRWRASWAVLASKRSAPSRVTQPPSSEDAAGLAFCCPGRLTDAPGAAVLTTAGTDRCFFDLLALLWHFGVRTQPWEQVSVVWWVLTKCRVLDRGDGGRPTCWASGAGPGACLPVPGCHIFVLVACWQWHLGLLGDQPSGLACDFLKAVHWAGSGL